MSALDDLMMAVLAAEINKGLEKECVIENWKNNRCSCKKTKLDKKYAKLVKQKVLHSST